MYEDFLATIRVIFKMESEKKQGVAELRDGTMPCSSSSSSSSKITRRVDLPKLVQSYEDSYQLKRGQPRTRTRTRTRTRAAGLCWLQGREGVRQLTEVWL